MKLFVKTISWRFIAMSTTGLISYVLTGSIEIATSIMSVEVVIKSLLYYAHEKIWIKYGGSHEK